MGMEEVGRILRAYREELRVEAEMCVYMYEVGLEEQNYVEQVGDYEIWVQ